MTRAPGRLRELLRAVGRRIRGDDDLEPVGRVVELAEVRDPPLDHRLLVEARARSRSPSEAHRCPTPVAAAGARAREPRRGTPPASMRSQRGIPRRAPSPRPRRASVGAAGVSIDRDAAARLLRGRGPPELHEGGSRLPGAARAGAGDELLLVHTGQHYDTEMSDVFLRELGLPAPGRVPRRRLWQHAAQTARTLERIELCSSTSRPDLVVVAGRRELDAWRDASPP